MSPHPASRGDPVRASGHRCGLLSWTALGHRMGYTRTPRQRADILAAIDRMSWRQLSHPRPPISRPAARAVLSAIVGHHLPQLVGVATLSPTVQLVGVDDGALRRYLLDLDSEAVYILAESHPAITSPAPAHAA